MEAHHIAGRHNLPDTVPIPTNDHRRLSAQQALWPPRTLRNPDQSPLLTAAAAIRGALDLLRVLIDRVIGWIPERLEWLDDVLREAIGPQWWTNLGWNGVQV